MKLIMIIIIWANHPIFYYYYNNNKFKEDPLLFSTAIISSKYFYEMTRGGWFLDYYDHWCSCMRWPSEILLEIIFPLSSIRNSMPSRLVVLTVWFCITLPRCSFAFIFMILKMWLVTDKLQISWSFSIDKLLKRGSV